MKEELSFEHAVAELDELRKKLEQYAFNPDLETSAKLAKRYHQLLKVAPVQLIDAVSSLKNSGGKAVGKKQSRGSGNLSENTRNRKWNRSGVRMTRPRILPGYPAFFQSPQVY